MVAGKYGYYWECDDGTVSMDLEAIWGMSVYSLYEVKVLIEAWRRHYNTVRPHSALGYRPPAPETILHHRPVPAFAVDGLRPNRASERMANRLT